MDLSVIIVSFNTEKLTRDTLDAIRMSLAKTPQLKSEIIVVDNASSDNSPSMIKNYTVPEKHIAYIPILHKENIGFGGGNNLGIKKSKGKYVLLLNSDLIADNVDFQDLIDYMDKHKKVGGLTVRVELPNGKIDPASHRGFPTVWRSFTYFTKLQHLTSAIPFLNKLFGGYHMVYENLHTVHEVDSPTAAFFLIRGDLLRKLKGFDEDYFMYGEDLDLAMRMRKKGYSIIYYPEYTVLHLKHQSGLKTKKQKTRSITTFHFHNAMKIFYDKHYAKKHPKFMQFLIHKAVDFKYWLSTR